MKILIVTGGSISLPFAEEFLTKHRFDRIIAADSGLAACHALELTPTDILGDFDSLKNLELREHYRKKGIPVREFPTRKDYTDTHLAVSFAIDLWQSEQEQLSDAIDDSEAGVWILGATGSRLDHVLANIGMLVMLTDRKIPCKILDAHNEMEVLKGPVVRSYPRREGRQFFSMIALGDTARGIDLIGFSYPLQDAELPPYVSLGVSNEITEEEGILRLRQGCILVDQSID